METEHAIRELIAKSCMTLERDDYKGYLELCGESFRYRITAYSPEIRKDMTWLEKNKRGMKDLLDLLPKQNMDRTPLTRHFSIFLVEQRAADAWRVGSNLQVFRTESQGGTTSLVAIGKYIDEIGLQENGRFALIDREVRLDTRMLGKGYHVPF
ncbi:methanesulfonate monooxygenase [Variovorax sp. WS11]|uniref:aromatic-ring-hydroxylating dioxygenase subunit beta n=1 Tax=Variovorax sp. WS11 TaxID=1105204 RepID=UPI000D0C9A9C|nr:aromatic-ring-hydroxylating dioxygenase subunit beta [Variovorax sp. WS11]NDZ12734.1 methanesulfonate monooxygenase [Variovorax sp. WS11]PSL84673.1 methanesulfonate monooxygenase [Variovorax sp. WS11]